MWENLGISDFSVLKLFCVTLRLTAFFVFHKKISADADKAISRDYAGIAGIWAESKRAIRTNEMRGNAHSPTKFESEKKS